MLARTRRSHNLNGLGYSPQQNNHHHAPNRYYHYRANHVGISYNSVDMTKAVYKRINNKSDYTVIYDTHNAYRRFRYGITIQLKDFKAMWVSKSQPIRLKTIWVPKTSL